MSKISIKNFNQLINYIPNLVSRPTGYTHEDVEKWRNDIYYYYLAMFNNAQEIPEEKKNMIEDVLKTVEDISKYYFTKVTKAKGTHKTMRGLTQEVFDSIDTPEGFSDILCSYYEKKLSEENLEKILQLCAPFSNAVVWNIDWVFLFSFQLPAVDLRQKAKYVPIAKLFLGIFTIELITKYLYSSFEAKRLAGFSNTPEYQKLWAIYRMIKYVESIELPEEEKKQETRDFSELTNYYSNPDRFIEYEFADIDPHYKNRLNYTELFLVKHPYMRFKRDDVFKEMFYYILSHTNEMVLSMYQLDPPLNGIIKELENKFPEKLFIQDEKQKSIYYSFIGFMINKILATLGYVKLNESKELNNSQTITSQSLYGIKRDENNQKEQ